MSVRWAAGDYFVHEHCVTDRGQLASPAGLARRGRGTSPRSSAGQRLPAGRSRGALPGYSLRTTARFAVAVGSAASLTAAAWQAVPRHLSVSTDVVGGTTFYDFNVFRYHDAYYLLVIVLPVLASLIYVTLRRWGPLKVARSRAERKWPPPFAEDPLCNLLSTPFSLTSTAAKVLVPAVAVGLEVRAVAIHPDGKLMGGAAAVGYVIAVLVTAILLHRLKPRMVVGQHSHSFGAEGTSLESSISVVNTFASLVTLPLLYLVSSHTSVLVVRHRRISYPWLPLWLDLVLTATAIGAVTYFLYERRVQLRRVETCALAVVSGSAIVFIIRAQLTPALSNFSGFDDSHSLVGAQLTFQHGLFPWRDLYLLHGPLVDDFFGILGIHVFSSSRWGEINGMSLIVGPLAIVSSMLLAAYFVRRRYVVLVGITLAFLLGLLPTLEPRFILLPLLLVAFDRVLRTRSSAIAAVFAGLSVLEVILTPETALLVISLYGTLLVFEAVHREPGSPLFASFYRGICCVGWAICATIVWTIFLIITGALGGFIDFFLTAIPGHSLEGAFAFGPLSKNWAVTTELFLPGTLVVLTYSRAVGKILRRARWDSRDWILVASAGTVALYYTEALDRIDPPHIYVLFAASLPLVVLWTILAAEWSDNLIRRVLPRIPLSAPVSLVGLVLVTLYSPLSITTLSGVSNHYNVQVASYPPPAVPRLGYTNPGTVDVAAIQDLMAVLNTYAGAGGDVYDFANDAGVTNYLLDHLPGTRFYDPALAQTDLAQSLLIGDLRRSKPRVIIFNSKTFGLFDYDGIWSMEREYRVSQYILTHYKPLLDTHGELILLRNDLLASAPPPPTLTQSPSKTGLYFDVPSCNWGDVPNFFSIPSSVRAEPGSALTTGPPQLMDTVAVSGWAVDPQTGRPPSSVVVISDGNVIAHAKVEIPRPDVESALHVVSALDSGFSFKFPVPQGARWQVFAVTPSGRLALLSSSPNPNLAGRLDSISVGKVSTLYQLSIPPGSLWSRYTWLHVQTEGTFGSRTIEFVDSSEDDTHSIALNSLPRAGGSVYVRAGSCIQWYGYGSNDLQLLISGRPLSLSVSLLK